MQPCGEGLIHPLHKRRVERMCTECADARNERLRALEDIAGEIRIDPRRWQEKYRERKKGRTSVEKLMLVGDRERGKVDSGVWRMIDEWCMGMKIRDMNEFGMRQTSCFG
jgi:hypothetical protein